MTQIVARRAFLYHLILGGLFYLYLLLFAVVAYWWRDSIKRAANQYLPESMRSSALALCQSRWASLFYLPIAILLFAIFACKRLAARLSRYNSTKRLSAQIFRRKLETAAKGRKYEQLRQALPSNYLAHFELLDSASQAWLLTPAVTNYGPIVDFIEAWEAGKSLQHSLAIQGDNGIGKSCLLSLLEQHFSRLKVVRLAVPGKITEEHDLFDFLEKNLGRDFSQKASYGSHELDLGPKTLVLLDEVQNFFLAKRGGFQAFRAFINLCNVADGNFFWCITMNRFAWTYLNAVTGGSNYFRRVFTIDSWSDREIRELIMSRHQKTGYSLDYDPIIFSISRRDDKRQSQFIEDRYFELLWDQAKGNPRTAQLLWLSALTVVSENTIMVGLPASALRPLSELTDNELFVASAILRHENLTSAEARAVTNLDLGVVLQALRLGIEKGFLERSALGRYRVSPLWQGSLTQSLMQKNFLYG